MHIYTFRDISAGSGVALPSLQLDIDKALKAMTSATATARATATATAPVVDATVATPQATATAVQPAATATATASNVDVVKKVDPTVTIDDALKMVKQGDKFLDAALGQMQKEADQQQQATLAQEKNFWSAQNGQNTR